MLPASTRGSYVIVMRVARTIVVRVGALGLLTFPHGYYAYVGSAMAGLRTRLLRHVSSKNTKRWHVDYLTEEATICSGIVCQSDERLECRLAEALKASFNSVPGFGCGDCVCQSHLFYDSGKTRLENASSEAMASLNGVPVLLGRHDLLRFLGANRG